MRFNLKYLLLFYPVFLFVVSGCNTKSKRTIKSKINFKVEELSVDNLRTFYISNFNINLDSVCLNSPAISIHNKFGDSAFLIIESRTCSYTPGILLANEDLMYDCELKNENKLLLNGDKFMWLGNSKIYSVNKSKKFISEFHFNCNYLKISYNNWEEPKVLSKFIEEFMIYGKKPITFVLKWPNSIDERIDIKK